MKRFTVGKLSMALAQVFVVALPVLLFPPYRPLGVTGPYAISTARYTYTDIQQRAEPYTGPREKRQVNVVFWYPEGRAVAKRIRWLSFHMAGRSRAGAVRAADLQPGRLVDRYPLVVFAFWGRQIVLAKEKA